MVRSLLLLLFCVACIVVSRSALSSNDFKGREARSDGLPAWQQVYSVLTSPRCINCHTATNYPQQGDDRHRHFANVIRGPEGNGVPGLNCVSCHQSANAESTGVPGGRNWHLAPLSMRWQDENDQPLSSAVVCHSLTDRTKNGGLNAAGLLKHNEEEPLVLWAWNPGRKQDGTMRTLRRSLMQNLSPPLGSGSTPVCLAHVDDRRSRWRLTT